MRGSPGCWRTVRPPRSRRDVRSAHRCYLLFMGMMNRRTLSLTVLATLALATLATGCSSLPEPAAGVLGGAEELEVFSIESSMERRGEPMPEGAELLHGNRVIAKAAVTDAAEREAIVSIVEGGLDPSVPPALCFVPRHAVRAKRAGKTIELVICYQCNQVKVFVDGLDGETLTTSNVQKDLDAAFQRAGLPPR